MQRFGEERMVALRCSWPTRSQLTDLLLAIRNSGEPKLYLVDEAAAMVDEEVWRQLRLARQRIAASETMERNVDAGERHDDFLMSIALLTEALSSFTTPPQSSYVRPRAMYEGESHY